MNIINDILPKIRVYTWVENEITYEDNKYVIGNKREKTKIRSIDDLKKVVKGFVLREQKTLNDIKHSNQLYLWGESDFGGDILDNFPNILSLHFEIEIEEIELMINQLIFDIIYDKYISNSPHLTLNEYCTKHLRYRWDGLVNISDDMLAFEKSLENEMLVERIKREITTSNKYETDSCELTEVLKIIKREFELIDNNKLVNVNDLAYYALEFMREYKGATDAANKKMSAEIKYETKIMNNPALRADAIKLGVNSELRIKHFNLLNRRGKKDITRRKSEWDYLYYNATSKLITYKQYRRKFEVNKKVGNYHNEHFIKDFKSYDNFIQTFMEKEGDTSKDYYDKSLSFYHLEIYKRLDFIYKLAVRMENEGFSEIDKEHYLVKRFCHNVDYLYVENDSLSYHEKEKYYRPLLFIEDLWQQRNEFDTKTYYDRWWKHHYFRARVYEAYNYHYEFASDNYDDISTFIRNDYNILSYHEPNKIWLNTEKKKKRDQDVRINNAIKINDALFWKSEKRVPHEWKNPDKDN